MANWIKNPGEAFLYLNPVYCCFFGIAVTLLCEFVVTITMSQASSIYTDMLCLRRSRNQTPSIAFLLAYGCQCSLERMHNSQFLLKYFILSLKQLRNYWCIYSL